MPKSPVVILVKMKQIWKNLHIDTVLEEVELFMN